MNTRSPIRWNVEISTEVVTLERELALGKPILHGVGYIGQTHLVVGAGYPGGTRVVLVLILAVHGLQGVEVPAEVLMYSTFFTVL
jgi:hypothetical protein